MEVFMKIKKTKLLTIFLILFFLFTIVLLSSKKVVKSPSDYLLFSIYYNGMEVTEYVNENDIANILMKYDKRISFRDYFPYKSSDIIFEINGMSRGKPIHILLGEFFICYETGGKPVYKIINGEELSKDLTVILEEINVAK